MKGIMRLTGFVLYLEVYSCIMEWELGCVLACIMEWELGCVLGGCFDFV